MRSSPLRRISRLTAAILVALICNALIATFLVAVNAREGRLPASPWQPLEVGVIVPPDSPIEPEPEPMPEPRETPREESEDLPAPEPLMLEWTPPDVREPAGSTLDLAVDVAIAVGFRVRASESPVVAAPAPVAPEPMPLDVLDLWQVDEPPHKLSAPRPIFPRRARRRGIEGRVVIHFVVGRDGRVEQTEVTEAEPAGYFETEALRALERWRFRPALYHGQPVRCRMRQVFTFKWEGQA